MPPITVPAFVRKWTASTRTERSASQEHFINLCDVLGHETPNDDPTGDRFAFEKGAEKTSGGDGFADVWKRGCFAWEYKGKRKNLKAAYDQLLQYREDLENPPLLVVCDLDRFEVHTNFTGTAKQVYAFDLAALQANLATPACPLPPLDVLRSVFTSPGRLRPARTTEHVTEVAAREFAKLAKSLNDRGHDPEQAARFLMRLLFCLFAEDAGLLPERLFSKLVENTRFRAADFHKRVTALFAAMATGGSFGADDIEHFDGGLFADDTALDLTDADLEVLFEAAKLDWASVEPAIFGTLFERSLDPAKRAQLGAHYTSRDDILLIVEPVLMEPLRRHWADVQARANDLITRRDAPGTTPQVRRNRQADLEKLLTDFQAELASVRVLDPACGSGNFLYVALKRLLDLEKEVITFPASNMTIPQPRVGPEQLYGIELNPYAHELAQVVVWIGYIQWKRDNGFPVASAPILQPLDNIRHMDAILTSGVDCIVGAPPWPEADVIIGNPPFLGGKRLRAELGDDYVNRLFAVYDGQVPREADLVTYWFERARAQIVDGRLKRAGLLATNSIRGGPNRRVLQKVKETGSIFMAWSDRPWILDGAAVRVSMIGFDTGQETSHTLDGNPVAAINADLTSTTSDLTMARRLKENFGLAFMGDTKGGAFDISPEAAVKMLAAPLNPNGRPNSDVVRPWVNGLDIVRRPRGMFIIDFGTSMTEADAALYEAPFQHLLSHVKAERLKSKRTAYRQRWWLHMEARPALREAINPLRRFLATPTVARHRLFVWMARPTVPDHQLIAIARQDDYFLGVLSSRLHEHWALRLGSWLGVGNDPRYTPTSTFETFPFPWPPGQEPVDDPRVIAIGEAARELHEKREAWLNPPDASEAELEKRTLTNLYNQRPTWLQLAHAQLDRAVLDAYGWPHTLTDDEILERLLALNLSRSST